MSYLHYILTIFLITILFSCSNDRVKLNSLEQENKRLHEEVSTLKMQLSSYKFMPILYPKSSTVEKNEKYEAVFFIGAYSDKYYPIVIVYDVNKPEMIDTLKYDSNVRGCMFNFSSKNEGIYSYYANMIIPTNSDSLNFPIKWDIEIK